MSLDQQRETDSLLPNGSHDSVAGSLQPAIPKNPLDGEALHRSEGDCTVLSVSANDWRRILHFIHLLSQRVESPLIMSRVPSDKSVRTRNMGVVFALTLLRTGLFTVVFLIFGRVIGTGPVQLGYWIFLSF